MRKKTIINILFEVLFYLVIFAYLLIIKSIYSVNAAYDFKILLCIAFLIIGLFLLSGSHLNKYIGFILCFAYTLYLVAQKTYFNGFGSYFRFSTVKELFSEVAKQGDAIGELFDKADIIPFVVLLLILIIFLVARYCFKFKTKYKWYVRLSCLLCFGICFLFANNVEKDARKSYVREDWQAYTSDYYLYNTINNPTVFVEKFGLLTYGYRDCQTFFEEEKNIADYKKEIDNYFSDKSNNLSSNEYTGLFKDKSLLVIQSESLINVGINEELTPTLYRMLNNGIEIQNFDTPLLIGSTSDSEFMANTSFLPETEGYSVCYQYVNNTYPLTLGNLFKENGYNTKGFHNNFAEYYNRYITFKNYGYDFFGSYDMGIDSEAFDSAVSEQIAWINIEKEKFMSFWISYSGHQPYEANNVGLSDENINRVRELYPDLDDEYVYYLAKIMDFDQAVEQYLNVMDWCGRLDDVVIVIYGDHIAKGLDFSKGTNYDKVFGTNSDDNPSIIYTPMFIYANNLEHVVIEKYCTALDIMPTLMNLWGFEYSEKYAFGSDILDDSYRGFSFDANGNCWNSDFYFNSLNNTITTYNGYSEDDARKIVDDFNKKRDICKKILKIDYFGNMGD